MQTTIGSVSTRKPPLLVFLKYMFHCYSYSYEFAATHAEPYGT